MASHDDDHTVVTLRPKFPKAADIGTPGRKEPEVPTADRLRAADDLLPLPQPGDPYKAHARPDNKPLLMLSFLLSDGAVEDFSYSDLRRIRLLPADRPGGGLVMVLRFVEAAVVEVRIEARRFDAMHNYIKHHRVAWVRELPTGMPMADTLAAVVTAITITQLDS
jgi:hypothetical protein